MPKISVFDLFSIGIGPSSSHTVGPMRAARAILQEVAVLLPQISRVQVEIFGSLALTGKGHGTDLALILGLMGETPEDVPPEKVASLIEQVTQTQTLTLLGKHAISFVRARDLIFKGHETLPFHVNGLRFTLFANESVLFQDVYYSVGGGFIVREADTIKTAMSTSIDKVVLPYIYHSADELLMLCAQHGLSIAELTLQNELVWRSKEAIRERCLLLWSVMDSCITRGLTETGILPGGLNVKRRAAHLAKKLSDPARIVNPEENMSWLNAYAMAVNEENAAGGRVVTAPTNGAAGIIPAVLKYHMAFNPRAKEEDIITYLLTAGAIGILYKKNASISGAEVGCQGEVGSACSMAAAGLTAVLGGTVLQVENAAEIGIEHHLGLTCDPIAGLVQIPCIERNGVAAVRAVNAARLALLEDGQHVVSLDTAITTMLRTGQDMLSIYKETSLGGLAVNHPEC